MNIIALMDCGSRLNDITSIIFSETLTEENLEKIIQEVRTIDEYCFDDIKKRLPEDCICISGEIKQVYW